MQLDKLTVNVRPLSADEAIDLGLNMARAWYWDLLFLWWRQAWWFVLLAVVFWGQYVTVELLDLSYLLWLGVLFYFLRPYFYVSMLLYLSRKLFDSTHRPKDTQAITISLSDTIKASLKARFSHKSHMVLAVRLLENKSDKEASYRLRALSCGSGNAILRHSFAFWLIEQLLVIGAVFLFFQLLSIGYTQQSMWAWFDYFETPPVWLGATLTLIYLLCVAMLSPFFVASGFALYVCRRSLLEGWDIELSFYKLQRRFEEYRTQWKKTS